MGQFYNDVNFSSVLDKDIWRIWFYVCMCPIIAASFKGFGESNVYFWSRLWTAKDKTLLKTQTHISGAKDHFCFAPINCNR